MAEFARLWTTFTGRRVIGLTTSTNAARVLAHEGLAESYNIAEFLGKTEGSDELRRPVPLHQDDVLVLDEASQLSTADLAMIGEAARQAGARIIATGDTAQLGAVEAGGMFRLLAQEVSRRRSCTRSAGSTPQWERQASVRLRDGDLAAVAAYDRHGRIRGADEEAAYDRAASMWLADHLRGKDVLLLAGSNAEAAELSRRVQAKLTQLGTRRAAAGRALRRQPRRRRRPRPRPPQHRDRRRRPPAHQPRHPQDHRVPRAGRRGAAAAAGRDLDRDVPGPTVLPRPQRRARLRRQRARRPGPHRRHRPPPRHRVAVPAGPVRRHDQRPRSPTPRTWSPARPPRPGTSPTSRPPPNPCSPASCSATRKTCPPPSRSARPRTGPGEPATCSHLWSAAVRQTLHPRHRPADQGAAHRIRSLAVRARALPQGPAAAAPRRPARRARHQRAHRPDHRRADGRRPVHLQRAARPPAAASTCPQLAGHDVTWAQRTPASAPAVAHELAAGLDDRARALGERMAASPEPWLARQLGVLAPGASPALREEYTRRAGLAAAYREAAGITNPEQAVSPEPHRGNPELENMRQATITALEIRDEAAILRGLNRGELEARVLAGERAQASAPPDVSRHSAAHCAGRSRRPTGNPQTPKSSTTKPARPAPRPSPRSWPPNGSGSKPATPDTRSGLPTPATPGKQLARPGPNSSAAGMPSQRRNRSLSPTTNRRRRPDGGASSKQISKPSNAPSPASTRPPSTPGNPGRPSAHPSWIAGPTPKASRGRRARACATRAREPDGADRRTTHAGRPGSTAPRGPASRTAGQQRIRRADRAGGPGRARSRTASRSPGPSRDRDVRTQRKPVPDQGIDPAIDQGYRLRLTSARLSQDTIARRRLGRAARSARAGPGPATRRRSGRPGWRWPADAPVAPTDSASPAGTSSPNCSARIRVRTAARVRSTRRTGPGPVNSSFPDHHFVGRSSGHAQSRPASLGTAKSLP